MIQPGLCGNVRRNAKDVTIAETLTIEPLLFCKRVSNVQVKRFRKKITPVKLAEALHALHPAILIGAA
jgi:hypothetical protein